MTFYFLPMNCSILFVAKSNLSDCLIEVYKCPKDLWFQSLEAIENKVKQNEAGSIVDTETLPTLAKPAILCKLKPPLNQFKFQTGNFQNFAGVFKQIETCPDIIGSGLNNIFTKHHIDFKSQLAEKMFNLKLTEESFSQLNGNKNYDFPGNKVNADFMFLSSNKIVPGQNGENPDSPVSLAVCWNNGNQLYFYALNKITKEQESKIEYTIPFSSQITHILSTKCNNLISIALKNNNIIVFDLNMGIERSCVHIPNSEYIKQLYFLPTPVPNKSFLIENSTLFKIETKLICLTNIGNLYLIDCTFNSNQKVEKIFSPKLADMDDKLVYMTPLNNNPNLLIVVGATQKLFVFSIEKSQLLSQLDQCNFPIDFDQIQLGYSIKNQQLFINGKLNKHNKLIIHSLKSISNLENYLNIICPLLPSCQPVNASLNDRANILLKNKIDEHTQRRDKLKAVWGELVQQRNNKKKVF
ncbi:unnamed protein product [Brachionus calyciflorus]|uniref:Uncharacterized protein n=1 Tax=Brachionus calyciflorus TaxID=104777 RepID=A0A814CG44_9BILA|nr:unnamed protein product [Brachionus calyciflorus]